MAAHHPGPVTIHPVQTKADKRDDAFDATGARIVLELPADGVAALKTRLRDATRDRARIDESGSEG